MVVSGAAFGDQPQRTEVPDHGPSAFEQWVDHIGNDTRADQNIAAAAELTRLVVGANESAPTGRTVEYP